VRAVVLQCVVARDDDRGGLWWPKLMVEVDCGGWSR
jgi:hypothetical protein